MVVSFVLAVYFRLIHPHTGMPALAEWQQLLWGVGITTACWLAVTWLTRPCEQETLLAFYKNIQPASGGWQPVIQKGLQAGLLTPEEAVGKGKLPRQIAGMAVGCLTVYAALFATGYFLYGNWTGFITAILIALVGGYGVFRLFK
jgi:hypothetical protein